MGRQEGSRELRKSIYNYILGKFQKEGFPERIYQRDLPPLGMRECATDELTFELRSEG